MQADGLYINIIAVNILLVCIDSENFASMCTWQLVRMRICAISNYKHHKSARAFSSHAHAFQVKRTN